MIKSSLVILASIIVIINIADAQSSKQNLVLKENNTNTRPRNIIFILADDHRFDALGFIKKQPFINTRLDQTREQDIAVNQVGYSIGDRKDFRIGRYVKGFQILNEQNTVVFKGRLNGSTYDQYAGCEVWKGEFTELNKPGKYIIQLSDNTRSWPFKVGNDIYDPLLQTVLRGLYVSRCGYAVKDNAVGHPPCHLHDADSLILEGKRIPDGRDATGGWHDGGDYWRSSMSASQTISRMLWPVELFPGKFDHFSSLLLPHERWGGRTDILTEIKWGLDWLFKLQYADGGISTGISPAVYQMPPFTTAPQNDPLKHYIGAANSSHTAKAGAVFARAARILKPYDPQFAESCLENARRIWKYLQDHPKLVAPKTIIVYGRNEDETDRIWLAVELFRTTGDKRFNDDFIARYNRLGSSYPKAPVSTQTIRTYNLHEALISYCFIKAGADKTIQEKILAGLRTDCDRLVAGSLSEGYGNVLQAESWKERHTIGNALQMAWELAMAAELTGHKTYSEVALRQLHFILGANPLGKVFITGVGSNPVLNPHYRPFSIRNLAPPGLTVKGPTHDQQFVQNTFKGTPPPPEKSYVDIVTAHQCNEPDIELQGHLIGLVAYFYATASIQP